MIHKFFLLSTLMLSSNCAPSWLDAIIGTASSDDKYNGYEQAPYTVTNSYGVKIMKHQILKYYQILFINRILRQGNMRVSTMPAQMQHLL